MFHHLLIFFFSIGLILSSCNDSDTPENDNPNSSLQYDVITVVDGITIPWGMAFLPDGALLITEQEGELIHVKNGTKTKVAGLPQLFYKNQGGLLDLELHPDYENNGWIYLSYSGNTENDGQGGNTVIMRAKLENNMLTHKEVLYKATPNTTSGGHFGSRLEFDRNGYLYFSIGDRKKSGQNPQDITRDGGKIYRIHDDGSIPTTNPFVNENNAKKAIYSYGHRNPQGMALHPETGLIWTHEHGPKGGDEINIIEAGSNYGWPKITYGVNYDGSEITDKTSLPGMEQPIHYWVPSIAPSGMTFVTSDKYPQWKGNVLIGSLKFSYLNNCYLNGSTVEKEEKLLEGMGRVRNVRQGPDGYIYVAIESKGIVKIVPKNS